MEENAASPTPPAPESLAESALEGAIVYLVRDRRVMLDADLAAIYRVEREVIPPAVQRNKARFPDDFMFQLTADEWTQVQAQTAPLSWGVRRKLPYVFTEEGAFMLANVLPTDAAARVSLHLVRAFVSLRESLAAHAQLSERVDELEARYDQQFQMTFEVLAQLTDAEPLAEKPIGFQLTPPVEEVEEPTT